jgi:small subunit ribosomal protein S13
VTSVKLYDAKALFGLFVQTQNINKDKVKKRSYRLARISGVDLPKNKKVLFGLQYIYGIGPTSSSDILEKAKIDPWKKVGDLTEEDVAQIRAVITTEYKVEGALRSEIQQNIKRLMDIGSHRGIRHRKGLPVRGQRTRTNSRTRKGKRKTVAGKKKTPTKK